MSYEDDILAAKKREDALRQRDAKDEAAIAAYDSLRPHDDGKLRGRVLVAVRCRTCGRKLGAVYVSARGRLFVRLPRGEPNDPGDEASLAFGSSVREADHLAQPWTNRPGRRGPSLLDLIDDDESVQRPLRLTCRDRPDVVTIDRARLRALADEADRAGHQRTLSV